MKIYKYRSSERGTSFLYFKHSQDGLIMHHTLDKLDKMYIEKRMETPFKVVFHESVSAMKIWLKRELQIVI